MSVTEKNVLNVLQNVNANKSSGPDKLSPIILKKNYNYLAPSITFLINKLSSEGVLPSDWLKANVCPVYKCKRIALMYVII